MLDIEAIEALEAAARKATGGVWQYSPVSYEDDGTIVDDPCVHLVDAHTYINAFRACDAEFICAANPAVTLALLRRLRLAEAVVEAARHGYDYHEHDCTGLDIRGQVHAYDAALADEGKQDA